MQEDNSSNGGQKGTSGDLIQDLEQNIPNDEVIINSINTLINDKHQRLNDLKEKSRAQEERNSILMQEVKQENEILKLKRKQLQEREEKINNENQLYMQLKQESE